MKQNLLETKCFLFQLGKSQDARLGNISITYGNNLLTKICLQTAMGTLIGFRTNISSINEIISKHFSWINLIK